MDADPTLLGERTRLRPWAATDLDAVYTACQDPAIQRWTTVPSPYARDDARAFLDERVPGARAAGGVALAVTDRADPYGTPVGAMTLLHERFGLGEIGYWVAAPARGRGLARDALGTLVRWCFTERPVPVARLEMLVEPDNRASRTVAEAAGFTAEGVLRQRLLHRGARRDVVMYARLASGGG